MIQYSKKLESSTSGVGPNGGESGHTNGQPDDGPSSDAIMIQVQSKNKPLKKSTKASSLKYKCIPSRLRFTWRLLLGFIICLTLLLSVYLYIDKQYLNNRAAYLLSAIDFSVNPCDDFFEFACGTWNKVHVIPEDRSSISTFEVLVDQLQIILRDILEKPTNKNDNDATIKAKTFYNTCINMTQITSAGDKTLKEILKHFGNWPITDEDWVGTDFSLETLLSKIHSEYNEGILIEQWVGPDDNNSSINIIQLDQTQLGLPSRDYYLQSSDVNDLDAYRTYLIELAVLLGADGDYARKEADKIIDFEIELANATIPESDSPESGSIYKKLQLNQLRTEIPEINWTELLSSQMKLEEDEPIVVYRYNYFKKLVPILQNTDKKTIFNYVMWRLIMELTVYLTDDYQKERVTFRHKLLGVITERSRWIQCVEWTNKKFGLAVGSLFIRDHFNRASRNMALEMIHALREAFNELLQMNSWMDEETKSLAIDKANAIRERIGYPDMITNATKLIQEYAGLQIDDDDFMNNLINTLKFKSSENSKKLRQPVDKDRWFTDPAVVNAFYNPNKNDIVFPAGILQPLFYSSHFPKSINYGGIGVVIGHEITHGFDDKGRQFDKDGNMVQWWNDATIKAFRNQIQCIVDQYSRYKINEVGLYVNGKMTKGENIADNGGLKQSFRAYQKWVEKHGIEPNLPGLNFTHEQLFFLNYAQIWCGTMRPKDTISKIRSSAHCPGQIRVIGPLSNSYDFAKAYNCPMGSPMNPKTKCTVW